MNVFHSSVSVNVHAALIGENSVCACGRILSLWTASRCFPGARREELSQTGALFLFSFPFCFVVSQGGSSQHRWLETTSIVWLGNIQ